MTTFPDGDVYVSKLRFGQSDSDSVRRLQTRLNEVEPEGPLLSITGNYESATDKAVRDWQASIGDTPDAEGKSFLGPKQSELLFKDSGNIIIDDLGGTTLGNYLKSKGHKVEDSNVPVGRDSAWSGVRWIIVHHTASPDSWSEKQVADFVKFGLEYPPLSQIVLGKSGTVWICSRQRAGQNEPGRATHAGKGIWPSVPRDRMNEFSLGIECQNNGRTKLEDTPVQYEALIKLLVDLCKRYNLDETKVLGHREWSTTGKIDPLDDMRKIRSDVKFGLAGTTNPVTPPKPVEPPLKPPTVTSGVKVWDDYSGKPESVLSVSRGAWVKLDLELEANPIGGREDHMLYMRLNFTGWEGDGLAHVECKYVRDGGTPSDSKDDDATAYDERHYERGTKSVPFQMVHWEKGEVGVGGSWYVKIGGSLAKAQITTRYSKAWAIKVVD